MNIWRVDKSYRHLKRYRQIITVFFKYGFADIIDRMNLDAYLKLRRIIGKRSPDPKKSLTVSARLRMAFEELGPTFIKLGQIISTRSFIFPEEMITELSRLQDEAKPVPFAQIETLLQKELPDTVGQMILLDPGPIASASIAQVYRATLPGGQSVVVKIQRPGIESIIKTDMDILHDLAVMAERHIPESKQFNPVTMVYELNRALRQELDFVNEARNIDIFRHNFENFPGVHVPRVYWDYTSARVVTMEFIDGIKISEREKLLQAGIDLKKLVQTGANFILKQIFEDGFFHADPHPGNLLVTRDQILAPVDFGIMGRLDEWLMNEMAEISLATIRKDVNMILRSLINLGVLAETVDTNSLRQDIYELLLRYYGIPLKNISMKSAFSEILDIFSRHRLQAPANFLLLARTLGSYEDIGRKLDPDFNIIEEIKPYIQKLIFRRLDPKKFAYETSRTLFDLFQLIRILPYEMELLVRRIRKGNLAIEFRHKGLEQLEREIDRASNRIAFGLIVAAIILASSWIMQMGVGPRVFGLPLLGFLGFLVSGIAALWFILAILRGGRIR